MLLGMRCYYNPPIMMTAALALLPYTLASSGDRAEVFQVCLRLCENNHCRQPPPQDLSLRFTRWTCMDDCKYRCMHQVTDATIEKIRLGDGQASIEQYYGKWPFWRLYGMQEPASVLFSVLNLYSHVEGGGYLMRSISASHPMRAYYRLWTMISITSWVCSALFHTRGV